mmetsp:Transcript_9111/g.22307  ORF Transcript_9111/g.22307 Transcript_9111/m.22307 type:complete len:161 (+) Transcript_9111:184-666(+)
MSSNNALWDIKSISLRRKGRLPAGRDLRSSRLDRIRVERKIFDRNRCVHPALKPNEKVDSEIQSKPPQWTLSIPIDGDVRLVGLCSVVESARRITFNQIQIQIQMQSQPKSAEVAENDDPVLFASPLAGVIPRSIVSRRAIRNDAGCTPRRATRSPRPAG